MATAKDLRKAILRCADDAMRDRQGRDVQDRAMTFSAYLCGSLAAMGETDLVAALRELLGLPLAPNSDGA